MKCVLRNNPKDNRLTTEDRINAILKWGYRKSIAVIKEIAESGCIDAILSTTFNSYIEKADEIYKHRNLYLHDLELADNNPLISYTLRRKLEDFMNPFLEPYQSHQFRIALDFFAIDCPLSQMAILDNNIFEFLQSKVS